MAIFKCLLGVVVVLFLAGFVASQRQWQLPSHKHQALLPNRPPQKQKQQQQQQQQQQHQSQPQQHLPTAPPHTEPSDKCQVQEDEKIACGPQGVTAEQCGELNCCFDRHQCYYGKAVTVQCTRDGQFVVVVARDATEPMLDVDAISLLNSDAPSCSPVGYSASFCVFQFPVTECGTAAKEEDGYIVYENHITSSYEVGLGPKGSITRDSHFELLFQCRYSGTAVEALIMDVNNLPSPVSVAASGPLRVELKLGNGECNKKGCHEEEAAYTSFYTEADYPIRKVLRDPIYVQVNIVERSDPNIVLMLGNCWATSSPNSQSQPQWDLLVDGCPYHEDHYTTTLVPVDASSGLQFPSHHKRFIFKMFSFVDQETYNVQQDNIFIHCATSVCVPSNSDSCQQQCHRQRRAAVRGFSSGNALVSSGQVVLTKERTPSAPSADSNR